MVQEEEFRLKIQELIQELLALAPEKELQKRIEKRLDRCGIMYRVFSRIKTEESLLLKMQKKREKYQKENTKVQDLLGIRVVLYFKDDIDVCIKLLKQLFEVVDFEHDMPDQETFKPQRINYVFRIPQNIWEMPQEVSDFCRIDNTFEIQVRTLFSEGWHEVEHDIRYKYKQEWEKADNLSRELNGIMAALEVCDNNILTVCKDLAYQKYKEMEWESMIRNKFRIRLGHRPMESEIVEYFNEKPQAAKELFRYDRSSMIDFLCNYPVPRTCSNIIYIFNELELHDTFLHEKAPEWIKEKCSDYLSRQKIGHSQSGI